MSPAFLGWIQMGGCPHCSGWTGDHVVALIVAGASKRMTKANHPRVASPHHGETYSIDKRQPQSILSPILRAPRPTLLFVSLVVFLRAPVHYR